MKCPGIAVPNWPLANEISWDSLMRCLDKPSRDEDKLEEDDNQIKTHYQRHHIPHVT